MNSRLLGTVCIVGTLALMVEGFRRTGSGPGSIDTLSSLAYVVWSIGGICAIIGLIKLHALGSNTVMRALAFLPIIGFVVFILMDGLKVSGMLAQGQVYNSAIGIGWIILLAGMLIVGILVIAAKNWRGWQRFVPLLAAVLMPTGLGFGSAIGSLLVGALIAHMGWLLLGFIIATRDSTSMEPQLSV